MDMATKKKETEKSSKALILKKKLSTSKTQKTKAKKKRFSLRIPFFGRFKYTNHFIGVMLLGLIAFSVWLLWGIPLTCDISNLPAVSTKILDRNG